MVNVSVPEVVTGEPETVNSGGAARPTLVTVPPLDGVAGAQALPFQESTWFVVGAVEATGRP